MSEPADAPSPEVSVIIAAWRAEDTVGRSVRSALAQTDVAVDVIVVDDASPDETGAAARAAAPDDPRLRVIRAAENGGPGGARNLGLEAARAPWAAVLDSDDTMAPGRLRRLLDVGRAAQADVVLDNMAIVGPDDQPIGRGAFLDVPPDAALERLDLAAYVRDNLVMRPTRALGFLKPVLRVDRLAALDVRYDPTIRNGEDYLMLATFLARGAVVVLHPETGYRYTRREGSLSARITAAQLQALLDADAALIAEVDFARHAGARAAFAERRDSLATAHALTAAIEAAKTGRLAAAGRALAGDAEAAGWFARLVFWKATGLAKPNFGDRFV